MFSYIHNFSQYQSYQRLEEGLSESSRMPYTNEKVEDLTSNVNHEEIDQLDSCGLNENKVNIIIQE
ncbi:25214_t:CDS:2 [Gigaspora margarita]|uniref:25214_t:CDS:1 n=1 Tax=Gigaspora margarita TaxID=4874 RepID=A0ABN7VIL8_GIGMA|nr:25214_t:CDS:2 [Gigaspora margarita]